MTGTLYYLFALLLFVAVVLFLEGLYVWWNNTRGPQARRIADRLRLMSAGGHTDETHLSILKQRVLADSPALQRALLQLPRVQQVDRLLEQSGLPWSVAQTLLLMLAAGVGCSVFGLMLDWPLLLVLGAAGFGASLPVLHVLGRKKARLAKLDLQLPGALELMAQALKAGHAFPNAIKLVADEMAAPVGTEFATTFDEVNFGISMKDALLNLAARVPVPDLRYFVIAALIQRETGGNLAELLNSIAAIIRSRHKLRGTVEVLAAEGKVSAWILCLLPFAVALLIQTINPGFMNVLFTDPLGRQLLLTSAVLMVIGIFWTRQLVRLRV